jgi:hypothetical protein
MRIFTIFVPYQILVGSPNKKGRDKRGGGGGMRRVILVAQPEGK